MAETIPTPTENGTALQDMGTAAKGLNVQMLMDNPIVRQLAVMVGIAASVAIGVAVVLWSQSPSYSLLFGNLPQSDAAHVMEALQQAKIPFRVDEKSGAVMVETASLHQARMKLAGLGLPKEDSIGYELLEHDAGLGASRSLEAVRYQRALEGELARSISTMANIESARVHLASPKQSVFVRARKYPSASVVLKLFSGRALEKSQIEAIVHLVASSVPELEPSKVTVVDHRGRLLNGEQETTEMREMRLSNKQFEYARNLEKHFKQRIEDILLPLLGDQRVKAEVNADVDFTVTEQTQESYNPDQPALRSEQLSEQESRVDAIQGVPGALTNQPPAAGTSPETTKNADGKSEGKPVNVNKNSTRNFELDRTLSHTRLATGVLRRLSVAVVIDDKLTQGPNGEAIRIPRTEEEVTRITHLVREAVGYSERRGDSVRVVNAAFEDPTPMETLPEQPLWEQPWFWDVVRQVGGVLLVLLLIFGVLRPTMQRLTSPVVAEGEEALALAGAAGAAGAGGAGGAGGVGGAGEEGGMSETGLLEGEEAIKLTGPMKYENVLEAARQLVKDDPKRVSQVIKRWLREDNA